LSLDGSGATSCFLTRQRGYATIAKHTRRPARSHLRGLAVMLAVIGNVLAGIGVVSLFTATLRLTRVK
jgi:hypothetical protein